MRIHMREKHVLETAHFFTSSPTRNYSRENSPFSISCFVLFLHLVVKPSGMNVILFPLIFIPKSRPCVLHTNLKQ